MAGRAGRRGLDSVGYVVYAPTLSVAGLRNLCPVHEMGRMLTADVLCGAWTFGMGYRALPPHAS